MSNVVAGWYDDGSGRQRWWDGERWGPYAESPIPEQQASAPTTPAVQQSAPATQVQHKRPVGLAIAALSIGGLAFFIGWLPVFGAIIGAVAIILGVIALVKKQSKLMSILGISLGVVALLTSIIMTAVFANLPASTARSVAVASPSPEGLVAEETPAPRPTEPKETEVPKPTEPTTPDLATFAEIDDRSYALMAKDPDAHVGENIILFGKISQFDSATGRCAMLIRTSATQKEQSYEYDQNTMAVAGDLENICPVFEPLVQDDLVKVWATVVKSFSYDTQIGGRTTVPMIMIWQAELLPPTEY